MNLLKIINSMSLRNKFVIPTSILMITSIIFISTFLIKQQVESYRRELETSGETMIRILAINAESGVLFESQYELDELLGLLNQFNSVKYAFIVNNESKILSQIGTPITEYEIIGEIEEELLNEGVCEDYYIRDKLNNEYILLNVPIVTLDQQLEIENLGITNSISDNVGASSVTEEIGQITLILSLDKVNQAIKDARDTAILVTTIVLILTIIMLTFFIKFITRPVNMLVEVTDKVSHGDYDQRVELDQTDEIGHLATTFNKMIDSLKQSRDEIEEYNRNLEQKIVERTLELEEIQQQLVQSEKLSAIGQLAAGVAHELNNPLGGILGYAQFTLEKLQKSKNTGVSSQNVEKYIKYLIDIETQAKRCKTIVQNLLRFSRTSRTSEFSDVNVNQVIEDTLTFMEHQLHMNQIELEIELDEALPLIQGNTGQLQQVLTNLVINAMHASPPESLIKIISRYSPPLGEFDGTVEMLIQDTGSGIREEDLKKIFEPFFTTKQVGKGTGLGLSVSYGIVKDHGGEIKVKSEMGEGSTFIITLPIQVIKQSSDNFSSKV